MIMEEKNNLQKLSLENFNNFVNDEIKRIDLTTYKKNKKFRDLNKNSAEYFNLNDILFNLGEERRFLLKYQNAINKKFF